MAGMSRKTGRGRLPSNSAPRSPVGHAGDSIETTEIAETRLIEINAIAGNSTKLDRITGLCAAHSGLIPFALTELMLRHESTCRNILKPDHRL